MKTKNERKNKHLTYKDRSIIQEFLMYGRSFTAIANRIHKDRTTIAKEASLPSIVMSTLAYSM